MRNLVLVHGTWGRAQPWHLPGSQFRAEAEARFTVFDFAWSGGLFGVPTTLPGDPRETVNGADKGDLLPWLDAGEKLCLFMREVGVWGDQDLTVLSHSHGLQVVAFSVVVGARYKMAASVSGPVRRDMLRCRRIAMAGIGRWVQFADPTGHDTTIVEGELFDGGASLASFDLPEGTNIQTPGTGHSGLLNTADARTQFRMWEQIS